MPGASCQTKKLTYEIRSAQSGEPEQARGQYGEAQPTSDQYSLGVLFYEMLTGQPLFAGRPEAVLHQHLQSSPPPPRTLNPTIPQEVERICLRCLEKEPARRFPDCRRMATCLRTWLHGREREGDRSQRPAATRAAKQRKRRKVEPATLSPWRRYLSFFLETTLWRITVATSIFAAGIAAASWVQRAEAVQEKVLEPY